MRASMAAVVLAAVALLAGSAGAIRLPQDGASSDGSPNNSLAPSNSTVVASNLTQLLQGIHDPAVSTVFVNACSISIPRPAWSTVAPTPWYMGTRQLTIQRYPALQGVCRPILDFHYMQSE